MTAPSLGRLLISHITLRGPEVQQLYALIEGSPGIGYDGLVAALVPGSTVEDPFGLQEAILREALNFLLIAGLVEQRGPVRRKASFRPTPLLPGVPFALLLLHHVGALDDVRQRALVLVQRQLVTQDVVAMTPAAIREEVERGPHRDLFAWTGEKIALWGHLAAYLGLVRQLDREAELLVVPQSDLVYAALRWAAPEHTGSTSLGACLQQIHTAFFGCFTSRGRVHRGLAQTLVALHRAGRIQLSHHADAARSILLADWRVSDVQVLV